MRKKIGLAFIAALALPGLFGCTVQGENYYTIDVYSDYIGMEEDLAQHGRYTIDVHSQAAAARGLKKVGYCYAVKGKDAKIGGMNYVDTKFNGKTSVRTPLKGHKYVFDGFVGYYGDGTAIDLSEIRSNCYLFATFTNELEDYIITVRNALDEQMYGQRMLYGESAKATAEDPAKGKLSTLLSTALPHDPSADPDDFSTWRDPHYFLYDFQYWRFSVEGQKVDPTREWTYDEAKNRSYLSLGIEDALDYRFEEATRITPFYAKSYRSFDVKIQYQIRTYNALTDTFEYSAPVKAKTQKVRYGEGVDYSLLGLDGYSCVGEGLNGGEPSRYGKGMDIPAGQVRKYLPAELCELYAGGYRGMVAERDKIAFDCELNLIFTKDVEIYTLNFHNDYDDPSAVTTMKVEEGQSFKAPAMVGSAPTGKVFSDWAVKNGPDELQIIDLRLVHESCDIYPYLVSEYVTSYTGKLTYRYDSDLKGYLLVEVDKDATAIAPEDFPSPDMDENYPFYGVDSFKPASGQTGAKITSIVFPEKSTVWWFGHGLFTDLRLSECVRIDLSGTQMDEIHAYGFHNLPRVEEINLPASLMKAGSTLFLNCTSLTKVTIDLTEAQVASRIELGLFAADWTAGFSGSITYKAI